MHAVFTHQRVALRCRIVLLTNREEPVAQIARRLNVRRPTVRLWRDRATRQGIGAVWDIAPGRGRKPAYGTVRIARLVESTLEDKPHGSSHWSTRAMAKAQGVSKSSVHRIWDDHQLKPHLVRSFKFSRGPDFVEKLTDIIGVYLTPPQNAIVLCVDEKSQIQALDPTQPGLPLKRGRCGTFTHDYKRHGTTTLFAAPQVAEGKVIGECYQRHRHQEFLRFLKRLDREFPPGKALHLVLDNYGSHWHPRVRVAGSPSPLRPALHPHQLKLGEPGRAVVRGADPEVGPTRILSQRAGPGTRNRRIPRSVEQESNALRLDGERREDPREGGMT